MQTFNKCPVCRSKTRMISYSFGPAERFQSRRPKTPPRRPQPPPRRPPDAPRRPQNAPRRLQDALRCAQDAPRRLQGAILMAFCAPKQKHPNEKCQSEDLDDYKSSRGPVTKIPTLMTIWFTWVLDDTGWGRKCMICMSWASKTKQKQIIISN